MLTQRSAEESTLMAQRPIARTDLRTKSISTSVEYLFIYHKNIVRTVLVNQLILLLLYLLFELRKNASDISTVNQTDHNIQFLQLDINGIIVLHKEHFDVVLQDVGP